MPPAGEEPNFAREEYLALSDQKAADFRTITGAVPTLFTVSGAIFVGGLTQASAFAVVTATGPMLLAVYQMAQNSRLQLTMTTFLSVCVPPAAFSFEAHAPAVRETVWKEKGWNERFGAFKRPSAYNTWLKITIALGLLIDAFPLLAGLDEWEIASPAGLVLLLAGGWWVWHTISLIESERETWTAEWERELKAHQRER
jgi:hypothetical protein